MLRDKKGTERIFYFPGEINRLMLLRMSCEGKGKGNGTGNGNGKGKGSGWAPESVGK
jgi:hypothetical protein